MGSGSYCTAASSCLARLTRSGGGRDWQTKIKKQDLRRGHEACQVWRRKPRAVHIRSDNVDRDDPCLRKARTRCFTAPLIPNASKRLPSQSEKTSITQCSPTRAALARPLRKK